MRPHELQLHIAEQLIDDGRRILDVFDIIQCHTLTGGSELQTFVTQLTPPQRQIASWFGLPARQYGR